MTRLRKKNIQNENLLQEAHSGLLPNGRVAPALPQYMIVAKDIVRKIHDGIYLPGEKIKSMREMASDYGVSLQVIVSAIELLSARNYVNSEPKRGLFVNWKLKSGRYYRIGLFVNNYNPILQSMTSQHLLQAARNHEYEIIPGSNFEETFDIGDWLDRKKDIDGLIIIGIITEQDLVPLRKRKIPYILLGNHPVSSIHPQQTQPVSENVHKAFLPVLKPLRGKRLAALMGSKESLPDWQVLEGIRRAILDSGATLDEKLLRFSGGDAFKEISELLEKDSPDVLYLPRLQQRGYAKYIETHPDAKRPYLICQEGGTYLPPSEISATLKYPNTDEEDANKAIEKLIAQMNAAEKTVKKPKSSKQQKKLSINI